jgi:hypothetical protein
LELGFRKENGSLRTTQKELDERGNPSPLGMGSSLLDGRTAILCAMLYELESGQPN